MIKFGWGIWVDLTVWGKRKGLAEDYPLIYHLLDAAAAAVALWESHVTPGVRRWVSDELGVSEDEAGRFVALLAGLHDVGKAIPCFQEGLTGAEYLGHAEAAYWALPTLLDPRVADGVSPEPPVAYWVGQLLGGHHGQYPHPCPKKVERPLRVGRLGHDRWHQARVELVSAVREVLGEPSLPTGLPLPVAVVLTGIVVVADWLVSDVKFIRSQQADAPEDLLSRYDNTLKAVRGRVAEVGLSTPVFAESVSTQAVWGFEPNALQQSIIKEFVPRARETGLLVIAAPTGVGKSEASFIAAHALGRLTGRTGLFVGLPTMATADQIWSRLKEYVDAVAVGTPPVTLAHSMARFNDKYVADHDITEWLRDPRTTLLSGLCVGTVDQALLAGLRVRHNALRMHALANKTVIIDEVHSYDTYTRELLAGLLSWCGRLGVPVVLLSATLPAKVRDSYVAAYLDGAGAAPAGEAATTYPGWFFVGRSGAVLTAGQDSAQAMAVERHPRPFIEHRTHDRSATGRERAIREYVDKVAKRGGSVAVLCNTVDSAQRTFESLRKNFPAGVDLILLHARFPHYQRAEITRGLLSRFGKGGDRERPTVVVATQILEQSLDLDFDLMISDLAPMALLIQRLGRCWRHDRRLSDGSPDRPSWSLGPRLVVLDPVDLAAERPFPEEWGSVYDGFDLAATHVVLSERPGELRVPGDVDALVQQVHSVTADDVPADLRNLWNAQYAEARARVQFAAVAGVVPASTVKDLFELTSNEVLEQDVSTRLGIDTARLVPRYTDARGRNWLDPEHKVEWTTSRPKPPRVKAFMDHSVTCPGEWVRDAVAKGRLTSHGEWSRLGVLRDVLVLPAPVFEDLTLDPELGLRRTTKGS
ncbi:CRISPR-associated endonuclease/helicase Cas3 [Actinokineospora baliensis]|uniref:CRISPR-associated helicase Cas3' n=1 Tax=Actinokineospora baliensis TaxID=547056 RepID=UPI00195C145C|nr:CRISPR-associated helicase Cas3' [Actinokineospora baliensis]MBM7774100.1 CRISPR-associated endonuclease/helicase Cas3 [Actinokineospora baliensis]